MIRRPPRSTPFPTRRSSDLVRRAGACGAAAAPAGREIDDPMPRMPTNSGEPMEELTPLDPSVAPPYNLIAERLFRARTVRSEERRVGKEGRSRWSPDH